MIAELRSFLDTIDMVEQLTGSDLAGSAGPHRQKASLMVLQHRCRCAAH